jgi:hypothetical protein
VAKSLDQRAQDAFGDNDASYAEEFVKSARESLKEVSDSLTRTTLLVLTLCAAFELLARAPGKITFFGIELTEPGVIEKLLPIVIAYLFYEQRILSVKWADLVTISQSLMRRFHPRVRENGLDTLLHPRLLALWDVGKLTEERYRPSEEFDYQVSSAFSLGVLILPLLFQIYAFARLFLRYDNRDVLVWVSLFLSSLIVASIVVNIYMVARGPRRKEVQED